MIIRVRTNVGLWRVNELNDTVATIKDVFDGIKATRPNVVYQSSICFDQGYTKPLDEQATLSSQGLTHGSMVYCQVDPSSSMETKSISSDKTNSTTAVQTRRIINSDGSIQVQHAETTSSGKDRGFRPGMMALRDMKMAWTLNDFIAMDDKFVFKIKRQDTSWIKSVSLDSNSCQDFYRYLSMFQFKRHRFGFLYGTFEKIEDEENKWNVKVEFIYEPPQESNPNTPEGFDVLDDTREERVESLANMLGLQKVGWIYGHNPRDNVEVMTSAEIIMAAEYQLEAAQAVEPTPFVTVKVTKGKDGNVSFEAFQVSLQCMEMVAEQALEIQPDDLSNCAVNETYTAIQEGKESKTVENSFFLTVVPIIQHVSEKFVCQFPKSNRDHDERSQTTTEMKKQLSKSGAQGWNFIDLLSDFHLLLYLCEFLDFKTDIPKICESVVDRDVPLDDGYKIIISSMAGLDSSY